MQTYTQTFAGVSTWEINAPGRYFTLMACSAACTIKLFKGGRMLDFGEIKNVLSGIEIGGQNEGVDFDRVQITTSTADTVTIGIGNGQVRYNRGAATVDVNTQVPARTGAITQAAVTVTSTAAALLAANTNRFYLLIQNKDLTGNIWINFAGTATTANGVKIVPGGFFAMDAATVSTQAISAIGDIASNANIVVVEG
jgi:hypothetical protein